MGSLKPFHNHLKNLQSQAKSLTETGLALSSLFAEEGTRLRREGEASNLRAVYRAVREQLQRLKGLEASGSCGHSQANGILFLSGFALTALFSKSNRLSAITDYLLQSPPDKQPFGLVMVYIGPKGLPEDVHVVSISQLARESNRPEPEIINKLREEGFLLFSEETFTLLISRLVSGIQEGRLHLPISSDKLPPVSASNKLKIIPVETESP